MSVIQNSAFFLLYDYLPETDFIMYYIDSSKRGYEKPLEIRDNHYWTGSRSTLSVNKNGRIL